MSTTYGAHCIEMVQGEFELDNLHHHIYRELVRLSVLQISPESLHAISGLEETSGDQRHGHTTSQGTFLSMK